MWIWTISIAGILAILVATIYIAKGIVYPTVKSYVYKETEQGSLKAEIHFPTDWKKNDNRPAILFFFGGGWISGGIDHFRWHANYFARRGLVTVRVDYRVDSRHGTAPDSAVEDARDAVQWLHQNYTRFGIDSHKIAVAGTSAGGHLAAATALYDKEDEPKKRFIPKLLVLFDPVLDLTEANSELEFSRRELELIERIGKRKARTLSPNKHIDNQTPASLIIIGTEDPLVKQCEEFVSRSQQAGTSVTMLLAADQGHGFANKEPWRSAAIREVEKFLVREHFLEVTMPDDNGASSTAMLFTTYQPPSPTTLPTASIQMQ